MKSERLHSWDVTPTEAVAVQRKLVEQLVLRLPGGFSLRYVAGADVSVDKSRDKVFAGVVVLSVPELKVVETAGAEGKPRFPYIPGLLTFREGEVLVRAFKKIRTPLDAVLFDGHGIAHPRGLGIAAHFGLLLGIPTIGVGKSRLVGEYEEPGPEKGSAVPLLYKGARVGTVLRTKTNVKPVFVSPGNLVDHASSVEIVLRTCTRYRLPEPTRLAHLEAARVKRRGQTSKLQ